MIRAWLRSQRFNTRALEDAHAALRERSRLVAHLVRENEGLASEVTRLREERAFWTLTSSCSDPAAHVRLAAQLQRADALLAEAQGIEPHRASLGEAS